MDAVLIPSSSWLNSAVFGQYGTNFGQNRNIFDKMFGGFRKRAYLCSVFFIVLDLRLTTGSSGVPFFCASGIMLATGWPKRLAFFASPNDVLDRLGS
jgi:hypothetical protein